VHQSVDNDSSFVSAYNKARKLARDRASCAVKPIGGWFRGKPSALRVCTTSGETSPLYRRTADGSGYGASFDT